MSSLTCDCSVSVKIFTDIKYNELIGILGGDQTPSPELNLFCRDCAILLFFFKNFKIFLF